MSTKFVNVDALQITADMIQTARAGYHAEGNGAGELNSLKGALKAVLKPIIEQAQPASHASAEPAFFINPKIIDPSTGKLIGGLSGAITWNRSPSLGWTMAVYTTPVAPVSAEPYWTGRFDDSGYPVGPGEWVQPPAPVAAQAQQPASDVDGLSETITEAVMQVYRSTPEGEAMCFSEVRDAIGAALTQRPVSGADGSDDQVTVEKVDLLMAVDELRLAGKNYTADLFTGALFPRPEEKPSDQVVQLSHPEHGVMQIRADILRKVASQEASEGTFIDASGTVWSRPTAYAYAMVCKARDKWQAKAEEARDSALSEAAQALAYRRNLLISQNVVNDIRAGVALYDICIDAVLSLQQNATSTDPDKPKRATPMGELVLQLFDALDEAMRLDKSPSAWKHNPAGTLAQRMEAWQKVHKLRTEIKEFLP